MNMDGTAMGVLPECVGWQSVTVARRYVRVTASAAVAGAKRPRGTAFTEADNPNDVRTAYTFVYSVPTG